MEKWQSCDLGCDRATHLRLTLKLGWKGKEGLLENMTKVETWLTMLGRKPEAFQVEEQHKQEYRNETEHK